MSAQKLHEIVQFMVLERMVNGTLLQNGLCPLRFYRRKKLFDSVVSLLDCVILMYSVNSLRELHKLSQK